MTGFTQKDKHGIALIIAVLLALGAMLSYNMRLASKPKADANNCILPINKKSVFFIDQSDSIPSQTSTEIVRRILNIVSSDVSSNELVTIFQITDASRAHLEPIFSKCKPARDGSELTENVRLIRKRFTEEFEKPLKVALATPPPKADTSPIGEVLIDLSLTDYLRGDVNRLVVFSDLMQNTKNISLYRCTGSKQAIADFRAHRAGAVERPTCGFR
jgi:hypothetical protein